MFRKSDKSQLNVTLKSKRSHEENDKNQVNYGNNWIQNSFGDTNNNNNNSKRVKADNRWTPLPLQSNATNRVVNSPEDMNMDEEEDPFNDGLDECISQVTYDPNTSVLSFNMSGSHSQTIVRSSDQNMSSR